MDAHREHRNEDVRKRMNDMKWARYLSSSTREWSVISFFLLNKIGRAKVKWETSVWSFVISIYVTKRAHMWMEESAKYHRLAYNTEIREREAECSKQLKANVKSLDSRSFSLSRFFFEWEKEIKLTISFCIHTHTYTYRVYVNIWYSVSPILPFDNDHIGTIIFRSE